MNKSPFAEYIASKCKADRIKAIDEIIDALILSTLESSTQGESGIQEYFLDDGQVKIRTAYRSVGEIKKAILSMEQLKNMYLSQCRGRITVLRNSN